MITKVLTIEEEIELVRKDEREEGRREEKIEIARTSIKAGIPKEVIAQITGLTILEIEALVEE